MIPPDHREASIDSLTRIITLHNRRRNIDETVQRLRRFDELRVPSLKGLSGDIAEIASQGQRLTNSQTEIHPVCRTLEEHIREQEATRRKKIDLPASSREFLEQ